MDYMPKPANIIRVIQRKVHIRFSLGFKLHPWTVFFFFQIVNWFCVSASTSAIYFFQQRYYRKVLTAAISGCNLICIRQIGKYLAFLWRPSISTRSGKIHLSKQFKQMPLIRYLSHHRLTSQFVIFPFRMCCHKITPHDSRQHNLKENTQSIQNDEAISPIKSWPRVWWARLETFITVWLLLNCAFAQKS